MTLATTNTKSGEQALRDRERLISMYLRIGDRGSRYFYYYSLKGVRIVQTEETPLAPGEASFRNICGHWVLREIDFR